MVSSSQARKFLLFSSLGALSHARSHLTARQDAQGGIVGSIPLCVVTAEGTLFTAISGVLPTDGCPAATGAAGEAQPSSIISTILQEPTATAPWPLFITIPAAFSGSRYILTDNLPISRIPHQYWHIHDQHRSDGC